MAGPCRKITVNNRVVDMLKNSDAKGLRNSGKLSIVVGTTGTVVLDGGAGFASGQTEGVYDFERINSLSHYCNLVNFNTRNRVCSRSNF